MARLPWIDENMPVFVIATNPSAYDKIASNIQEVKARKGVVVAVVTDGDQRIRKLADYTIEIPTTEEPLAPLLSVIPLQLLAYHIALLRGCNVDQPPKPGEISNGGIIKQPFILTNLTSKTLQH